jgi:uncharacterized membrane protein YjjB (DUF3815 family)
MSTVACAGYATSFALSNYVNTSQQVVQLVPAFVVGVLGNGWTKWKKQMSFDAILLGAFFLVPGNITCLTFDTKASRYFNILFSK